MNVDYELVKERRKAAWRADLRNQLKTKERMALPRAVMPTQDGKVRAHNNEEVALGISRETAMAEAKRCIDCAKPTCMEGCPVAINIPTFIKNIERGDFKEAIDVIHETSSLPGVCGRVCPQEKQCEAKCIHTKSGDPAVAIGFLERFVADWEREQITSGKIPATQICADKKGIKVAVVGSGPAGLACASDLAKMGYTVTVFEALHELGGVLRYGIPEFRLPNEIVDFEIDKLKKMGIDFKTNIIVGKTLSYEDLADQGFRAIFVGSGAGLPRFMGIPGENFIGIMSSNEYLTRVNLMHANTPGADTPIYHSKRVAVIGGGNTAMDAVRTALRLGAEHAMIVYRRSEEEMPARREEIEHAKEEGVDFMNLYNPIEYLADESGHVTTMRLQHMRLGEPDEGGRRRPIPIEGDIIDVEVDEVIVSIGVQPNPIIPTHFEGLKISSHGTIEVDEEKHQSQLSDVFAGGDIVRGGATVILAMGDGRTAAAGMNTYLMDQER